jgi:hypothetical protein
MCSEDNNEGIGFRVQGNNNRNGNDLIPCVSLKNHRGRRLTRSPTSLFRRPAERKRPVTLSAAGPGSSRLSVAVRL